MKRFKKQHILILSTFIILFLAFLDYATGLEFGFSIFYLGPILLATWFHSKKAGIFVSILSAGFWFVTDSFPEMRYSNWFFPIWNTFLRLGFFLFASILLNKLKIAFEKEKQLSKEDSLTGLLNTRAFYISAEKEIQRNKRYHHPLSLCYIDLDNFKSVNDKLGHLVGNLVLKSVANEIKHNIRSQDICGRMGGDEFVVLLPETDDESIKSAANKLNSTLLEAMKRENWGVTFSIGAATFTKTPDKVDDLIKIGDDLMYKAKSTGKNRIIFHRID